MDKVGQAHVAPVTVARDLNASDLRAALAAGWGDLRAYPAFGLFFAAICVGAGLVLYYVLSSRGEVAWLIPAAAGMPPLRQTFQMRAAFACEGDTSDTLPAACPHTQPVEGKAVCPAG